MKRTSLIAVGTEIVTGDINNSNTQWISKRAHGMGIEVVRHISVGDDKDQINAALDICALDSDIVFLTGGLGPTADDFTRNVVSEWTKNDLEFNKASWQRIQALLSQAGVTVAESNQRQCFFPIGARIFINPAGTANAFSTSKGSTEIICLPGPPREIAAVWEEGMAEYVEQKYGAKKSHTLWRWHCLGHSESQLGELVERVLEGSHYLTAYRPQIPYVEIKVSAPADKDLNNCPFLQALDQALSPWLAFRGEIDLAQFLLSNLAPEAQYSFLDRASQGILAERLFGCLRHVDMQDLRDRVSVITGRGSPAESEHLVILEAQRDGWQVIIDGQSKDIPFARKLNAPTADRLRRYCTEKALLAMAEAWFIRLP